MILPIFNFTKRKHSIVILLIAIMLVSGCVPQRRSIRPGEIPKPTTPTVADEQYGHTVLTGLSEKYELDYNDPRLNNIIAIVDRLTTAAGANNDPWHVYLFKTPEVKNAAATRGNHVFVWSGLLDITKSDDETATFIAHEIAHVIAGHTEPDPSEQLRKILIGAGAVAAGIAVTTATKNPTLGRNLGNLTSQLTQKFGSGLLVNPYSREKELEADHVGLFLMADAKYNPEAAIKFWGRIQSDPTFSTSLEFFSTHPPPQDRLSFLKKSLPHAKKRFAGIKDNINTLPKNTTSHNKDSFNWSGKTKSTPTGRRNWRRGGSQPWRVTAKTAFLYKKPTLSSKKLGEFTRGAVVNVTRKRGKWLEIERPDRGFLLGVGLIPEK